MPGIFDGTQFFFVEIRNDGVLYFDTDDLHGFCAHHDHNGTGGYGSPHGLLMPDQRRLRGAGKLFTPVQLGVSTIDLATGNNGPHEIFQNIGHTDNLQSKKRTDADGV